VNARQANFSVQVVSHTASAGGASGTSTTTGLHLFAWHYDSLSPRAELQELAHYLRAEVGAEMASESTDPDQLFAEERQLLAERQVLPLLWLPEYVGIAPGVRNWSVGPSGEWRLAEVWLDAEEAGAPNGDSGSEPSAARGAHR